ncbi:MAG: hypothetical protein P1U32_00335 [Legionellaceae bacterium]|nr:hypothetical protein [Legionellaceae bacterium]
MITVVVSVFNEMQNPYLSKIIQQFKADVSFELVCIDGGSADGTIEWLTQQGVRVEVLPHSTRAARLNLGMRYASYPMVLLQHPRSIISDEGVAFIKTNVQQLKWAAFTHQFDTPHFFLKFISWYSNYVRIQKKGIVYLDHCVLINRAYLTVAPLPDIAIFEDTALSDNLRCFCSPELLPFRVVTSAIRFLDRGIYKQFLLNQWIKFLYSLNVDSKKINRLYEKKLNLNQKN